MTPDSLIKVDLKPQSLSPYRQFTPQVIDQIEKLATPFQNLKVAHLNTTSVGGGVAEMLKSVVPLQRDLGLDSTWYIIPPNDNFFEITKSIHNFLQGKPGDLTPDQKQLYQKYNQYVASLLDQIQADILLIHDPQPAAALSYLETLKPHLSTWRCHIDTSHPNQSVWDFFQPFWQPYDSYVFTLPQYAHQDFPQDKLTTITPVIDPLTKKNQLINKDQALKDLQHFDFDLDKPFITQISRFDPWKDPIGVIDAFAQAKKHLPDLQLILMGQTASDDPEGQRIYQKVRRHAQDKDDIFFIINDPDNAKTVRALQTASDILLQKSLREGFGLTVTEAMWKKAVVIGGNVGGIKLQIQDGHNGFLIDSPHQAADHIVKIINHPQLKESISQKAHQSVKQKYLLPHLILNYLKLWHQHLD